MDNFHQFKPQLENQHGARSVCKPFNMLFSMNYPTRSMHIFILGWWNGCWHLILKIFLLLVTINKIKTVYIKTYIKQKCGQQGSRDQVKGVVSNYAISAQMSQITAVTGHVFLHCRTQPSWACGSSAGWDTTLQSRSQVQISLRSLNFPVDLILPAVL